MALIWALTLLWFEVVKPCAEEDSVLTQASSLLGPPLHGSEGLQGKWERKEKEGTETQGDLA